MSGDEVPKASLSLGGCKTVQIERGHGHLAQESGNAGGDRRRIQGPLFQSLSAFTHVTESGYQLGIGGDTNQEPTSPTCNMS